MGLIDGSEFDSSYKRGQPTTFAPNQVIKGWTEAMQLMVEGDKWEMYIPSDLGYGPNGSPPKIPGGATLIFTMEIIKIKGDKVMKAVEWTEEQLASGPLRTKRSATTGEIPASRCGKTVSSATSIQRGTASMPGSPSSV